MKRLILAILQFAVFFLSQAQVLQSTPIAHYNRDISLREDSILSVSRLLLKSPSPHARALANYQLGLIERQEHDLSAISYYLACLDELSAADTTDLWLEEAALVNAGAIFKIYGEIEEAVKYFQRALLVAKKLDAQNDNRDEEISVKYNIANALSLLFDTAALSIYHEILELAQAEEDFGKVAQINNQIGLFLIEDKKYPEAINALECNISLSDELKGDDQKYVAMAYHNLANIQTKKGELEEAKNNLQKAITIHAGSSKFYSLMNLADVLLRMGDLDAASEVGQEALAMYEDVERLPDHIRIFELMSAIHHDKPTGPIYLEKAYHEQKQLNADLARLNKIKDRENLSRIADTYHHTLLKCKKEQERLTLWVWIEALIALVLLIVLILYYDAQRAKRWERQVELDKIKDILNS